MQKWLQFQPVKVLLSLSLTVCISHEEGFRQVQRDAMTNSELEDCLVDFRFVHVMLPSRSSQRVVHVDGLGLRYHSTMGHNEFCAIKALFTKVECLDFPFFCTPPALCFISFVQQFV